MVVKIVKSGFCLMHIPKLSLHYKQYVCDGFK